MHCRHCTLELNHPFLDLGFAPPSNAYLSKEDLSRPEITFPLRLRVCEGCFLVQTEDYAKADEIFKSDYAYFSSTSRSWLEHAKKHVDSMVTSLGLTTDSFCIEVASNDGYLLKNFVEKSIPCLGIEPTASTALAAEKIGVPTLQAFFGLQLANKLASEGKQADLIIGNNVYAHVPDINDFTKGLKAALKQNGTITLEFPHLLKLMTHVQFDTVYHEHFSYFSLFTVMKIFASAGLRIFDVEELSTHGGSLRIFGCHDDDSRETKPSVGFLLEQESEFGLQNMRAYDGFQEKADAIKNDLLLFLLEKAKEGKKVAAYGAAAKGNTLLNYAGVKGDLLSYVCDAAPSKQGKYLPGSHIPIMPPEHIWNDKPDYVVILPWNIQEEIVARLKSTSAQFVVAIPKLTHL